MKNMLVIVKYMGTEFRTYWEDDSPFNRIEDIDFTYDKEPTIRLYYEEDDASDRGTIRVQLSDVEIIYPLDNNV